MSVGTVSAPSARAFIATALLGTVGAVGLFAGFGSLATWAALSGLMTQVSGPAAVGVVAAGVGLALVATPAVCVLAVTAAVGLYRGRRWGRRLGLFVGGLLVLSPLFRATTWSELATEDPLGQMVVPLIGHHLFLAPPIDVVLLPRGIGVVSISVAMLGLVVLWGLVGAHASAKRQAQGRWGSGSDPPRRVSSASAILVLVGVIALLPVGLLVGSMAGGIWPGFAAPSSHGAEVTSGGIAPLLIAGVPSLIASLFALLTARRLVMRSAAAPYLAPPATAVASLWASGFIVWLILGSIWQTVDSGLLATVAPVAAPLTALAAVIAGTLFVGWAVATTRAWFAEPLADPLVPRPTRRQSVVTGLSAVTVVALLALPALGPESWNDLRFAGQAYRYAAPLNVTQDRLVAAGLISEWRSYLSIRDTTAYTLPGLSTDMAIVVAGPTTDMVPQRDFELFVRQNQPIPAEWCPYVPVDDPLFSGNYCGPPDTIDVDGQNYWILDRVVPVDDLTATGRRATTTNELIDSFDLTLFTIEDVDPTAAVALRVGDRVVPYRAPGRLSVDHPLCQYPTLSGPSSVECLGFESAEMFIEVRGQEFRIDLDLFEIPRALLSPHDAVLILSAESPPTNVIPEWFEPTVFRIEGVDPALAVALIIDGRVRLAEINDGNDAFPPAMCAYLHDAGRAWLDETFGKEQPARHGC